MQKGGVHIKAVAIGDEMVPVKFGFEVFDEELLWKRIEAFRPFGDYCARMDAELAVKSLIIEKIIWFGKPMSRIGFMLVNSEVYDEDGDRLPGAVFLRGPSVVIPLILRDENDNDFLVLTEQARPAVGQRRLLEVIAGTLDGSGNISGKAVDEVREETGIEIYSNDLYDLAAMTWGPDCPGVYASPGGSDELFLIYACVKKMSFEAIAELQGKLAGNCRENEKIVVRIVNIEEAFEIQSSSQCLNDAKSLAALFLIGIHAEKIGLR